MYYFPLLSWLSGTFLDSEKISWSSAGFTNSWIIENLVKIFFSLSSREEVTLHYNYVYNEKIKQFSLKGWLYLRIFYFVWIMCPDFKLVSVFWQRLVHVQSSLRLLIITWNNSVHLISLKWEHFSCNMRENYK